MKKYVKYIFIALNLSSMDFQTEKSIEIYRFIEKYDNGENYLVTRQYIHIFRLSE